MEGLLDRVMRIDLMQDLHNLNIESLLPLVSPRTLKEKIPVTAAAGKTVSESRQAIQNLLSKKDDRFLVIVGPCSIHDTDAAIEYAKRLATLKQALDDRLFIVMRVYFEKPRTTVGWKGLINDPHLDGSCDMNTGLEKARQLLLDINDLGVPVATEVLDPISPQYVSGLVSWASVGARTTESQTHREMASGLSMPVGFKNNTDGSISVAIHAMQSSYEPHSFIGINQDGSTCIVRTKGNHDSHIILRGGSKSTNYSPEHIAQAVSLLEDKELCQRVLVDCSHANSGKKFEQQEHVLNSVVDQVVDGNENILGVMIESNLKEGSQSIPDDLSQLEYGVSVTDQCISWETTEKLLREIHSKL